MFRISSIFCLIFASNFLLADELIDEIYELKAQVSSLEARYENTAKLAEQTRANAFNPSISVVGDILGQAGFGFEEHGHDDHHHDHGHGHSHDDSFQNGLLVREIELELRGDIDPSADALVAIAFGNHGSHLHIHVEEAYLRLKKWPGLGFAPLGLITKVGRFKTSIGRMNRLHLHNTPQITYPLATRAFLGEEGYMSQGVSFQTSFNPTRTSAVNIFAEAIFNSRLPMQGKKAKKVPTALLHAWWHQELASSHFMDFGVTGLLGRQGESGSGAFLLLSADFHYSYLPHGHGLNPVFLLGGEVYAANKTSTDVDWPIGGFLWGQYNLVGSTFLGARYDISPKVKNHKEMEHAISGYLTHYTTEFLRLRLGYEHVMPKLSSIDGDHRFMLSLTFVLGSHPVEPYFINR